MKTIRFILTIVLACFVAGLSAQDQKKEFKPGNDGVYYEVQVMPEFPGGFTALQDFLVKNIRYPEQAKKDTITGKVFVQFVIDEHGKVTGSKIIRGVAPVLDKEALRVINIMPDWTPGKQEGKAVKVAFTLPIMFALK
jgi:TonB family protein